ncbi:MAG: hypothetical protein RMJ43_03200 [Chloroherpetonaceae bacterium]|nr:hypothetical protein [Chthonomonadaceae bacterium]MDW8206817.1 hypothetical protein [Chloroherpetonaceae bacterium]
MRRHGWWISLCILLFLGAQTGSAQEPGQHNSGRGITVPRKEINDWLRSEIVKSGGDFESERYRFIIGFSTGHYGQDPVHAIAMRRVAFSLLNNTLAAGDQVTPVAWEMRVWDRGAPIALTEDPATRKQFVDAVPYTTQKGSRGGHDTERALYEILQALSPEEAKYTVVLLLTNSNQSQGPTGERVPLFGANNPLLLQALQRLRYRIPPVRHSFVLQHEKRNLVVDVTALFPQRIHAIPGTPGTRRYPTFPLESWQPEEDRPAPTEILPNPVAPAATTRASTITPETAPRTGMAPAAGRRGGIPLWVWIVLALLAIALAVLAARALAKPRPRPEPMAVAAAGQLLPGAVEVFLGQKSRMLHPLKTTDIWHLVREGDEIVFFETGEKAEDDAPSKQESGAGPAAPPGHAVATLQFDKKRRLCVEAMGDTQFLELKGVHIDQSNNRMLSVGIGERLFCRMDAGGVTTRLELIYHKEKRV